MEKSFFSKIYLMNLVCNEGRVHNFKIFFHSSLLFLAFFWEIEHGRTPIYWKTNIIGKMYAIIKASRFFKLRGFFLTLRQQMSIIFIREVWYFLASAKRKVRIASTKWNVFGNISKGLVCSNKIVEVLCP